MIKPSQLPLLFGCGLAAGFVDAIAGGGGMITVPVLLSTGLPPQDALGTNKLQAVFGSAMASVHYTRAGAVDLKRCVPGFAFSLTGAVIGSVTVRQLDPALLRAAIPVLLIVVAAYMLLQPNLGGEDAKPRLSENFFYVLFGLGLGFYDGFFGPGTGTFWTMAFMLLLGYNMVRATGHTKVMNFASNLASLIVFAVGGNVLLLPGLVMGAGQLLGARLGAGMAVKKGRRFIRTVFLCVVLAITARMLWR